jgi:hypothetical protein
MGTTLPIDYDVFFIAKQKAQREKLSIGKSISELMRASIHAKQLAF